MAHLRTGVGRILRNGELQQFALIQERLFESVFELGRQLNMVVPSPPSLRSQERWARIQIGLLCDLMAISDAVPTVGRPLSSVTIDLDGTVQHSPATADLGFV
jgi:hypothetical protein